MYGIGVREYNERMIRRLAALLVCLLLVIVSIHVARADELDDISTELEKLKTELQNKQTNQQSISKQVSDIRDRVQAVELGIVQKEREVQLGEKSLVQQKLLLDERARSYYKNIHKSRQSLLQLFVGANLSSLLNNFFYQKTAVDQDRNAIIRLALYISDLEEKKKSLESEKVRLAQLKVTLDKELSDITEEIKGTESKIAQLSAKQQQLIAQKQASLNIPVSVGSGGARGCSSDLTNGKDPGFSPRIGFFTYGVPNRTGLNQYGAKGRAEAGQNSDQILRTYYNFDGYDNKSATIRVNDGNGYDSGNVIWEGSLEDYMLRLYEIPESWPLEAQKAQAIAARSYVIAQTNNGQRSICATESCQVVKVNDPKGGQWQEAVSATSGQVMTQGGNAISAYFSSTHGGYIYSTSDIGWSATSYTKSGQDASSGIGSWADLQNNAYDKQSPWFYCDWGSRSEYGGTAWLKPDEVADIFNVIDLARRDSGTVEHLYQPDNPPSGVDVWSRDKVRDELKKRGGNPLGSVSDVSIGVDFGSGKTTSVSAGGISASGSEFKSWFNLRAPANIQIVGPLYNVEKQ